MHTINRRPCVSCPYRQDVPSGVWDASEYEKLNIFLLKTERNMLDTEWFQGFGPYSDYIPTREAIKIIAACSTLEPTYSSVLHTQISSILRLHLPDRSPPLQKKKNTDWFQGFGVYSSYIPTETAIKIIAACSTLEPTDYSSVLRFSELHNEISSILELHLRDDGGIWDILGARTRIAQILTNQILNYHHQQPK